MRRDAVIVCGMQRAYFHKSGSMYFGDKSEILKIRLQDFLREKNSSGAAIFFIREVHQVNDKFFQNTKTYGLVGTEDIKIPEVFKPFAKLVINTARYSGFYRTALDSELNKIQPYKVHLVGMETHTTVLFTAEDLKNRDYDVVVHEPLVCSEDDFMHSLGINILSNVLSVEIR